MEQFSSPQLVAVYGSLRAGMGNAPLIQRGVSEQAYEERVQERVQGFEMFSLGGFPAVRHSPDKSITIEVYEVPPSLMRPLDGLEGHPRWYVRELVPTSRGNAWLYVMDDCDTSRPVPNGDWVQYRSN